MSTPFSELHAGLDRLRRLVEREELPPPAIIDAQLTLRCFMRCRYCRIWTFEGEELGFEPWRDLVTELRAWLGPFQFIISGGEPLLVPYLTELLEHCRDLGVQTSLTTNGRLLDDPLLERLGRSGLGTLVLSLDALSPTHDQLRDSPGLAGHLRSVVEHFGTSSERIKLKILSVISRANLGEIETLLDWAEGCEELTAVLFQALAQPFSTEFRQDWYLHNDLWPDDLEAVDGLLDRVVRRQAAGGKIENERFQLEFYKLYFRDPNQFVRHRCNLGRVLLKISNQGQFSACFHMGVMGDLARGSVREQWYSRQADEVRRRMRRCDLSCNLPVNCNFKENAALVFGDRWREFDRDAVEQP